VSRWFLGRRALCKKRECLKKTKLTKKGKGGKAQKQHELEGRTGLARRAMKKNGEVREKKSGRDPPEIFIL